MVMEMLSNGQCMRRVESWKLSNRIEFEFVYLNYCRTNVQ